MERGKALRESVGTTKRRPGCRAASLRICGRVGVPGISARLAALWGFMARALALR